MSSLEELIAKAKMLHTDGHSPGQIADELSLSMETVTWLLTQHKGEKAPRDVHIDWTAVSSRADMLGDISIMMFKQFFHEEGAGDTGEIPEISVVVGIAQSGIPIATLIAAFEELRLTLYHPRKHAAGANPVGSLSGNFASITGERCLIVDDVITSGKTMEEVVSYLRSHGATPVAISVIFDKRSLREVDGVPVYSLFKVTRVD